MFSFNKFTFCLLFSIKFSNDKIKRFFSGLYFIMRKRFNLRFHCHILVWASVRNCACFYCLISLGDNVLSYAFINILLTRGFAIYFLYFSMRERAELLPIIERTLTGREGIQATRRTGRLGSGIPMV